VIGALVVLATPAGAATLVVDDFGIDADATPGDGVCATGGGVCSWPAAVEESNVLAGPDIIVLAAGTYAGAEVVVSGQVEVTGQGVGNTTLDAQSARRHIEVTVPGTLTIRDVTLSNGQGTDAGSILNNGILHVRDVVFTDNQVGNLGGAILNGGTTTVERTTFAGNQAGAGGAIFSGAGTVDVATSTFTANVGNANATAIHLQGGSKLTLVNSTLSGNGGDGFAVVQAAGANSTILHSTIVGNDGGLAVFSGVSTIGNSIIAGNVAGPFVGDCSVGATITSLGGNLSSDATCVFTDGTDLESTDPLLLALADNGGPTQTHALQVSSPALDSAVLAECEATDQRGVPRPTGLGCDRGAYEDGAGGTTTTTLTGTSTTSTTIVGSTTSTTIVGSTTSTTIVGSTTTSTSIPSTTTSTSTTSTSTTLPGVGIEARKLVIVDRGAKAKMLWVAKNRPEIAKGASGDSAEVSGSFEVGYTDVPTNAGRFAMPAPWAANKEKVAKYKNKAAPGGGGVAVAIVKPGKLAKVVAKSLGDDVDTIDLVGGGEPSASGGITTILTVVNGTDGSTHRMCSRFATAAGSSLKFKEIAKGAGRKLLAKGGFPFPCP
jgi:hypothetical protein